MFDFIDDINPLVAVYALIGLIIGFVMMKFSGPSVPFVWKIFTIIGTTIGAAILGFVQTRND